VQGVVGSFIDEPQVGVEAGDQSQDPLMPSGDGEWQPWHEAEARQQRTYAAVQSVLQEFCADVPEYLTAGTPLLNPEVSCPGDLDWLL